MPTQAEITAQPALTADGAGILIAYVRSSVYYRSLPGAFPTLSNDITALVGDPGLQSRFVAAILTAIEGVGPDGTIGVKGGRYGADYSLTRDRDQLCELVLSFLYDTGLVAIGQGQIGAQTGQRGDDCCPVCYIRCHPCLCWFPLKVCC